MKQYYILEDGIKRGAFSLKDLKYQKVLPDTLIWKEGWEDAKKVQDAAIEIPELDLIIYDPSFAKPTPEETKKKSAVEILTSVVKASEGDLDEIGSLLNKKKKDEATETTILENKPSFTTVFYRFIGKQIDQLIEKHQEKVGYDFFFTKLSSLRNFYKSLSENRQRSFVFLCSCFLVFLISGIISLHAGYALVVTIFWSGFAALNQIKFIDGLINTITDWTVLFTLVWLPKVLKRMIAKAVKFIFFLILLYFIGFYLGIIYLIYRIAIVFINPSQLPSFEQGG